MSNNADANDADTPNECKLRWARKSWQKKLYICVAAHKFVSKHFHKVLCRTFVSADAYCFGIQAKGIISISTCIFLPRMYFCMSASVCVLTMAAISLVSHFFFSLPAADNPHTKCFCLQTFRLWTHLNLLRANWASQRVHLKHSYKHFEMERNATKSCLRNAKFR